MKTISILGTGCPKCKKLYQNVEEAVSGNADYKIEKITDIMKIMKFDVIVTPALTVDGKVIASGKVLSVDEIKGVNINEENICYFRFNFALRKFSFCS